MLLERLVQELFFIIIRQRFQVSCDNRCKNCKAGNNSEYETCMDNKVNNKKKCLLCEKKMQNL